MAKKPGSKATSKKPKYDESPPRQSMLATEKVNLMLAVLIRNVTAFLAVHELLTPEKLQNKPLAVVWKIVRDFHSANNCLPLRKVLLAELHDTLKNHTGTLSDDELDEAEEFIEMAFKDALHCENLSTSETQAKLAIKSARRLLEDQLALKAQDAVHDGTTRPADLPAMLTAVSDEARMIACLDAPQAAVPFPTGWDKVEPVVLFPTGISVFDAFLGGGHRAGEVNLFFGPYASCKSIAAVMGVVEGARYAAAQTLEDDWNGRKQLSVLVSYETPPEELRARSLSYAATIPRSVIDKVFDGKNGGFEYLSTSENLRDYEKELFKAQIEAGEPVLGERERAEKAIKILNDHALFLDMTGTDPTRPGVGNGYVGEIARSLEQELRRRKDTDVLVVWVDYLGAMVRRHIEASDRDYSDMRHLLCGGVLQLGNQVAKRFKCPVWVNHQLSGQANSRAPAAMIDHTDAAEAKNVAENADFAIVTGKPTSEQLCVFRCTKHRRQPPKPSAIVRIDGGYNRVIDVSSEYALVPGAGIMAKEDLVSVAPEVGVPKKKKSTPSFTDASV
ncbi:MAG: hypothetical protein U0792_05250 [Gemmataceae bacterium]